MQLSVKKFVTAVLKYFTYRTAIDFYVANRQGFVCCGIQLAIYIKNRPPGREPTEDFKTIF